MGLHVVRIELQVGFKLACGVGVVVPLHERHGEVEPRRSVVRIDGQCVLERLQREVGIPGVKGRLAKFEPGVEPARVGLGRLDVRGLGPLPFLGFLGCCAVVEISLGHLPVTVIGQGRAQVFVAWESNRAGQDTSHLHGVCGGFGQQPGAGQRRGRNGGA